MFKCFCFNEGKVIQMRKHVEKAETAAENILNTPENMTEPRHTLFMVLFLINLSDCH